MAVVANLIGFDGDAFSYINSVQSDIVRRFIYHVFTRVDSRMNRPDEWPKEPLDCTFFAKVLSELGTNPLLTRLINDEIVDEHLWIIPSTIDVTNQLIYLQEGIDYISNLHDSKLRGILNLTVAIIINLFKHGVLPQGNVDVKYIVQTIADAFCRLDIVCIILNGEGRQLDWW